MKNLIVKMCVCSLAALLLIQTADAQRGSRRRSNNNQQQPSDTTGQGNQQNNITAPPTYNPYANVPIEIDSTGISDTSARKSLRQDNAFDKSSLTARTPLPYEHLRWDDALFAEKVWR